MGKKKRVMLSRFLEILESSASEANRRLLLEQENAKGANPLLIKQMKVNFSANVSKPGMKGAEDLCLDFGKSNSNFSCAVIIEPLENTCAVTQKTKIEGEH